MAYSRINFTRIKGDDLSLSFEFKTNNRDPLYFTGSSLVLTAKTTSNASTAHFQDTGDVLGNVVTFNISSASNNETGYFPYDIQRINSSNQVKTLVLGTITIKSDVNN